MLPALGGVSVLGEPAWVLVEEVGEPNTGFVHMLLCFCAGVIWVGSP